MTAVSGVQDPVTEQSAVTAADGTFVWELPTGTYQIRANCGEDTATVTATLDSSAQTPVSIVVG